MASCPTNAIITEKVIDARRCISYLTIEKRGVLSNLEREMIGEWIFGCDVCQDVCPFNYTPIKIGKSSAVNLEFEPSNGTGALVNLALLFEIKTESEFRRSFTGTPLLRPKREGLIRNGLCVAANTGAAALIPLIHTLALSDLSPVVRATALWSLSVFCEKWNSLHRGSFRQIAEESLHDPSPVVSEEATKLLI